MDNGASIYRRFLEGDEDALGELIAQFSDGLILYLKSITGNICIAEEIMEEGFVTLVVDRPKYSGKSSFKTWLYAIARHTAADCMKEYARLSQVPVDEMYHLSDEVDIQRSYIKSEEKTQLHNAIGRLKPDYAQVLYLVYSADFTNSETADIMKKSKRQIENLLYRAKNALKEELRKEGFVYEEL